MSLVDGRQAGIFWQSRMGNNADGIGGNCHSYDIVTADREGHLAHGRFLVDLGIKLGHRGGYSCEFPSPEGILPRKGPRPADGEVVPEALLLTHGHEDHVGAIRHAIDMGYQVPPIRCTAFTAEIVAKSLVSAGIDRGKWPTIKLVEPGQTIDVAHAKVEFVPMDHMPGAVALRIQTPEATVFHTGDYKFDDTLLLGERANPQRLREIGNEGVDMVVSDSTSVAESGEKISEKEVRANLARVIADNKGRAIVVGILGTQLDRLASLGRAAAANDRALVITGRSLVDNVVALRNAGIDLEAVTGNKVLTARQAQDLPADRALVVTTGAFAQYNAGLTRAAESLPGALWIGPDTTVIIPQRAIPSVKGMHSRMVNRLEEMGAQVVTAERAVTMGYGPIHQSGHAIERDARLLYSLLKPRQLVAPMHGDRAQIEANAKLAENLGVAALPMNRNGAVVRVTGQGAAVIGYEDIGRIGAVETGEVKDMPRGPRGGEARFAAPVYRYEKLDAEGRKPDHGKIAALRQALPAAADALRLLGMRRRPSR